jgi:hypothetical protein
MRAVCCRLPDDEMQSEFRARGRWRDGSTHRNTELTVAAVMTVLTSIVVRMPWVPWSPLGVKPSSCVTGRPACTCPMVIVKTLAARRSSRQCCAPSNADQAAASPRRSTGSPTETSSEEGVMQSTQPPFPTQSA